MKFLVMFRMELSLLSTGMAAAVAKMPQYAEPLEQKGKVVLTGAHPVG